VIEWLDPAAARWSALLWALFWPATVGAVVALGLLIPWLRRFSSGLALAVAAIALAKFFVPPVMTSPAAVVDRASAWLTPAGDVDALLGGWVPALMLIHLAGVAWMLVSLIRQHRRLEAARTAGRAITAGPVFDLYLRCARRLGCRTLPVLIITPAVSAPAAIGVRRPAVLLPERALDVCSARELPAILAHELGHHKRHDLVSESAVALATAIWWFHPAVWVLAARIRALREERCDALVVATVVDVETYCRALLRVAASTLPSGAVAMRRTGHSLSRRFERLLRNRSTPRWQLLGLAGVVLAFAAAALPHSPDVRVPDRAAVTTAADDVREDLRVERIRVVVR
jgi:beta-lactamase regulating signal transducer with metallopeptidase domain